MIKINLLSPDDRLNSKWEKVNRIIVSSAVIIIIMQLIFVSFIFVSIKYLEIESGSLNKQLENLRLGAKAQEIALMQSEIKNYDNHLKCVNQIQEKQLRWTKILNSLNQIVPDTTRIKMISIKEDKKNEKDADNKYKMIIKGESGEKDHLKHLLEFENNLKESEIFELLVEDYLEKNYISNIDFEFRALINESDVITEK